MLLGEPAFDVVLHLLERQFLFGIELVNGIADRIGEHLRYFAGIQPKDLRFLSRWEASPTTRAEFRARRCGRVLQLFVGGFLNLFWIVSCDKLLVRLIRNRLRISGGRLHRGCSGIRWSGRITREENPSQRYLFKGRRILIVVGLLIGLTHICSFGLELALGGLGQTEAAN